jgi:hypothetical protein
VILSALAVPGIFAQLGGTVERIANLHAVVTTVTSTGFEVLTNPNADPQSAYRKENKAIRVDAATVFVASARADLRPGRGVEVIGQELPNGEVRATRVSVYEGNRPVRMRKDAVIIRADGSRQ